MPIDSRIDGKESWYWNQWKNILKINSWVEPLRGKEGLSFPISFT